MTARKNPFVVGQRVKAKLGRGQVRRAGDSRIIDLYRYTVTAVDDRTVGLDDTLNGELSDRWPAEWFALDEVKVS